MTEHFRETASHATLTAALISSVSGIVERGLGSVHTLLTIAGILLTVLLQLDKLIANGKILVDLAVAIRARRSKGKGPPA